MSKDRSKQKLKLSPPGRLPSFTDRKQNLTVITQPVSPRIGEQKLRSWQFAQLPASRGKPWVPQEILVCVTGQSGESQLFFPTQKNTARSKEPPRARNIQCLAAQHPDRNISLFGFRSNSSQSLRPPDPKSGASPSAWDSDHFFGGGNTPPNGAG